MNSHHLLYQGFQNPLDVVVAASLRPCCITAPPAGYPTMLWLHFSSTPQTPQAHTNAYFH